MCNDIQDDIRTALFHLRLSPRMAHQLAADRIRNWLDSVPAERWTQEEIDEGKRKAARLHELFEPEANDV